MFDLYRTMLWGNHKWAKYEPRERAIFSDKRAFLAQFLPTDQSRVPEMH